MMYYKLEMEKNAVKSDSGANSIVSTLVEWIQSVRLSLRMTTI